MASEITLRMKIDRKTGTREYTVEYESDDDALPMEHEKRHKEIVDDLVKRGVLDPNAKVTVERVKKKKVEAGPHDSGPQGQAKASTG